MKISNKHNLPEPLYRALARDDYSNPAKFGATSLNKSPRQRILTERHWDEIEVDATDRLWMVLGTLAHLMLERANYEESLQSFLKNLLRELNDNKIKRAIARVRKWLGMGGNALVEETLCAWDYKGEWVTCPKFIHDNTRTYSYLKYTTIQSTFDRYTAKGIIQDWKLTSVWAWLLGGLKPEWEAQLNIYAWLTRLHGLEVNKLQIIAIFRDHVKGRAEREADYPDIPIKVIDVPLWPHDTAEAYVNERVELHLEAEELVDDELPECTPEEKWQRPYTWAVIKKGNKRATKVFDDGEEAMDFWLARETTHNLVGRPGESACCKGYCDAAKFCNQNPYRNK